MDDLNVVVPDSMDDLKVIVPDSVSKEDDVCVNIKLKYMV
jgi:hypothetical protein